jgi:hypothetical protein
MLSEHEIYLINAGIDGELDAAARAELEELLAGSEEARVMHAELLKLTNILDAAPQQHPPEGLSRAILDRAAPRPAFSLRSMFSAFQPATAGVAFAAGLLATVAVYEWVPGQGEAAVHEQMVGTLVAGRTAEDSTPVDRLDWESGGFAGELVLRREGGLSVLDVDVTGSEPLEIRFELGPAGLDFGGLMLGRGESMTDQQEYEVSGGTLRVASQGSQAFTLFLPAAIQQSDGGKAIRVGVSAGGEELFTGAIGG